MNKTYRQLGAYEHFIIELTLSENRHRSDGKLFDYSKPIYKEESEQEAPDQTLEADQLTELDSNPDII